MKQHKPKHEPTQVEIRRLCMKIRQENAENPRKRQPEQGWTVPRVRVSK